MKRLLYTSLLFIVFGIQIGFSQTRSILRTQLPEQIKVLLIPTKEGYEMHMNVFYAGNSTLFDFLEKGDKVDISWKVFDEKDQKEPIYIDSLFMTTSYFFYDQKAAQFKLKLPPTAADELVVMVQLKQRIRGNSVMFVKRFKTRAAVSGLWLSQAEGALPYLRNFIKLGDTYLVNSLKKGKVSISEYSTDEIAMPPMLTGEKKAKRKLLNSMVIESGAYWKPTKPGFYVLKDSSHTQTIFVTDKASFPKFNKASQCLQPLIYVATNDERDHMMKEKESYKKRLDDFLLTVFDDKETAKKFMKAYFKRVEAVNDLFTTNCEGWMTDKGMLYLIFGAPDKVYLESDADDWSYEKNPLYNELNFYIKRFPDVYSGTYDEMERLVDYQKIWYGIINKWRKGLIK